MLIYCFSGFRRPKGECQIRRLIIFLLIIGDLVKFNIYSEHKRKASREPVIFMLGGGRFAKETVHDGLS